MPSDPKVFKLVTHADASRDENTARMLQMLAELREMVEAGEITDLLAIGLCTPTEDTPPMSQRSYADHCARTGLARMGLQSIALQFACSP